MRSKTLSFSMIMENWKKQIWVFAICCLGYFAAYPLMGLAGLDRLKNAGITQQEIQKNFLWSIQGGATGGSGGLVMILVFSVILGMIAGINGFAYLHSRVKTDFYHSLPIRRETLYGLQVKIALLDYLIPAFVGMLLFLLAGAMNGVFSISLLGAAVTAWIAGLLCFFLAFVLAALAMLLTGRVLVGILGSAVFMGYFPLVSLLCEAYADHYFVTYAGYMGHGIWKSQVWGYYGSPLGLAGKLGICLPSTKGWLILLGIGLVSLLLGALGIFVYKKRPSEAAGTSMAFRKTAIVIQVILVATATLFSGLFFESIMSSNSTLWFVFGLVFGFILFYTVIQMIYQMDLKQILEGKISMAVAAFLVILTVCVFQFDLLGFDRYMPKQEAIANINVIDYSTYQINYGDYSNTQTRLDGMEMGVDDNLYQFTRKMKDGSRQVASDSKSNVGMTESIVNCMVEYQLKNGRRVYRTYNAYVGDVKAEWKGIYDNSAFLDSQYPIRTTDSETIADVRISDGESIESVLYTAGDQEINTFIETLQKETNTLDGTMISTETPVARLAYSKKNEASYEQTYYTYVYPSFTKSIALLKEKGYELPAMPKADQIQSITAYLPKDPSTAGVLDGDVASLEADGVDISDEVTTVQITDKTEIAQLLPALVEQDLATNWETYYEDDALAQVNYTDSHGKSRSLYCYIRENKVPEFLSSRGE